MDAVPVLFGQVHDVGAPRHAGIVHQNVDLPERVEGGAHHAVDLLQVADIRLHAPALGAGSP